MNSPSLSILVPARNEAGNIRQIVQEIPDLPGVQQELIFIEGNSTDNTWREIQTQVANNSRPFPIRAFKQPGKGKADAVRKGCREAQYNLVIIFDADRTVSAKYIRDFYEQYGRMQTGLVIGNRFHFPMEPKAMRPLNYAGNWLFAWLLSAALRTRVPDSLCGMKLFSKQDWLKWQRWMREELRAEDPFGDFELLFPAAAFGVAIQSIPVPYRARTYGATNIRRFRDGFLLLRLTITGWVYLRGRGRSNSLDR